MDFLTSGALKWLCGGPGLAYLYVRPELELTPTTLSWFGVEKQFAFDIRDATPRRDARRFEMGTPPVGAVYTASGGLAIVEDLAERLREAGFPLRIAPDPERRAALVLARHPDAAAAVGWLAERDVIVDFRGSYIRFSPHFYNTLEDNERAVAALLQMPAPAGSA